MASSRKNLKRKLAKTRPTNWVLHPSREEMRRTQAVPEFLPAPPREATRIDRGGVSHGELARWITRYLAEHPDAEGAEELRNTAARFEKFDAAAEALRVGANEEAIALLEQVVALNSRDALAKLNLAQCLANAGQFERAFALAEEIHVVFAANPRYMVVRFRAMSGRGDKDGAVAYLRECHRQAPGSVSVQQEMIRAGELIPVGHEPGDLGKTRTMTRERYEESLGKEIDRVLHEKNWTATLASMAQFHLEGNMPGPASLIARRMIDRDPQNLEGLIIAGVAESRRENWQEAEDFFRRALAINPAETRTLSGLGYVCSQTDRLEEARELLLRALDVDPNYSQAAEQLILQAEDDDGKLKVAQELQQRHPEAWLPTKLLGDLDVRFGQIEDALAKHRAVWQKAQHDDILTMILHDLDRLGRIEEAVSVIEEVKDMAARSLPVRWNAANIYLKSGRLKKAAKLLEALVADRRLAPDTRFSANLLLNQIYASG